MTGNDLLARSFAELGVEAFFFVLGGPLSDAYRLLVGRGIQAIDVRHEQAGAMMAHAYSRVTGGVGVAMGCSGPGALNLLTGVATAWADCAPMVAIGGSSPLGTAGVGTFQEADQVSCFSAVTKWSTRVTRPDRIPEVLGEAFQRAREGRPGPVYVDLPADVLYGRAKEQGEGSGAADGRLLPPRLHRPLADPSEVGRAAALLAEAERPLILAGSGVLWSGAADELRRLVDRTGIPFFTTPQGRGVIPEDHPLALLAARSAAFRQADVVLLVGTRRNHMIGFGRPPRFAAGARFIHVDIDPGQFSNDAADDIRLLGDAKAVLGQLIDAVAGTGQNPARARWVETLAALHARKTAEHEALTATDQRPIHPLRLAREVRHAIDRDAILVVDGQEILAYCRQTIPSYRPANRLNSGPFGTMGVGLPFAIGAKIAAPDRQVVVVHGDGSFGMNAMEIDTAVRHGVPVVCVISNNGGWTADRGDNRPGRNLATLRYDLMGEVMGAHAEHVEAPEDLRPALLRALAAGRPAVVNVVTDPTARADQVRFAIHDVD